MRRKSKAEEASPRLSRRKDGGGLHGIVVGRLQAPMLRACGGRQPVVSIDCRTVHMGSHQQPSWSLHHSSTGPRSTIQDGFFFFSYLALTLTLRQKNCTEHPLDRQRQPRNTTCTGRMRDLGHDLPQTKQEKSISYADRA